MPMLIFLDVVGKFNYMLNCSISRKVAGISPENKIQIFYFVFDRLEVFVLVCGKANRLNLGDHNDI